MKKRLLFLLSCSFLVGCNANNISSPSELSNTSSEISENSSSSVIDSSSSGVLESSSFVSSESTSSSASIDNSEKEYYKNLVDRSKITYSEKLENDETHKVRSLEIFELNDTHGAYYDGDVVGIGRVKTCINENTIDPYATVKIANGDMLQGSAFSNMLLGEPAIASLNEMDFDCFVIGNHEFDWGLQNLAVYKDNDPSNGELDCPFLGANIVDGNGEMPSFIEPYTIVNKGDVKVGIIGIIGDGLESSISKLSLGEYHFSDTLEAVNKYSKILKDEEKVDVIIVSSHDHVENTNQKYVDNNDIDAIINGHDHLTIEETVTRYDNKIIPVIESQTKNGTIGKITLTLDDNKKMTSYEIEHFKPESYELDSNLDEIMDVYYDVVAVYQNEVIGYTLRDISKQTMAILSCNYIASKYDADLVFVNTTGVRGKISSGDITNGSVYEVFPFDNELYICELKGSEVKSMIAKNNVSTYYYNDNTQIGKGSTYNTSVDDNLTFKVITVDYLATKSYMSKYFDSKHGLIQTGDYIRECAIEAIIEKYGKSN